MDMKFLDVLLPMMFDGLKLTILIAVVGIGIGVLIGSLCGYLQLYDHFRKIQFRLRNQTLCQAAQHAE